MYLVSQSPGGLCDTRDPSKRRTPQIFGIIVKQYPWQEIWKVAFIVVFMFIAAAESYNIESMQL